MIGKKFLQHVQLDFATCTAATKVICGPSESELIKERVKDPILEKNHFIPQDKQ